MCVCVCGCVKYEIVQIEAHVCLLVYVRNEMLLNACRFFKLVVFIVNFRAHHTQDTKNGTLFRCLMGLGLALHSAVVCVCVCVVCCVVLCVVLLC